VFYDATGDVFLFASDYKFGMGEQLLKVISAIESNKKMTEAKGSCSKP
jgi:hypothetical protein